MLRNFTLTILVFISINAFGQATLYSGNFETPFVDWTLAGTLTPNSWINNTCAGNGPSGAGNNALYISQGGAVPGCGVTGTEQYSYTNSLSGSNEAIAYTTIVGNCASSLQATFDYKIEGVLAEDFAQLVYSINGGASWIPIGANFTESASWTTSTVSLPALLGASTFLLGVRFTYNNSTINGVPVAIDNFIVTGSDSVDPLITCPVSLVQEVDASCVAYAADYTKGMILLSDNCTDSANIIITQSIPASSIIPVLPGNSASVTLTAFDESGNSAQCTFTLNIIDLIIPAFTFCPPDTVIYLNSNCDGLVGNYMSLATGTDNCSGSITLMQNPPVNQIISGENVVTPVTITITDASGNTAQCTLSTLTIDTIVPTIICPTNQTDTADAICQATLLNYTGLAAVNDNCIPNSSLIVTQDPVPGTIIPTNQVITLTVSNGFPNIPQSCQFTVSLIDTIRPTINCPSPSLVYLNSDCEASIPDYTSTLIWADNCTILANQMTFSQIPIGGTQTSTNQPIVITATDFSGNSTTCSLIQNVIDTIKPNLTCPLNQTVDMNSSCFAVLPDYTSFASDIENCFFMNEVIYTQSPAPSTTLNGVITVTIEGEDESGNIGTCSFTVTPIDNIDPTVVCPGPTTVNTNAGCTYILPNITTLAIGNDNCTSLASLTYTQTPIAGTVLATGTHTITVAVFDQIGNTSNCSYQLTVLDQTIPVITCPSSQNVSVDINCSGILLDYTSLVAMSDNCSSLGQLTIDQSPSNGTSINANTPIEITVTDLGNNIATCTFFAVTIDNIDPIITCPSTYDVAINSSCQYPVPDLSPTVTGTDNCSVLSNMTITQNPTIGSTVGGMTAVLITLMDEQGNSSTCITMMTPLDSEIPLITCPSPAPINNGTNCDYTLTNFASTALVLDNCSGYSIIQTPASGTILQSGEYLIQLEVTDVGGNIAQCSFNIDINESINPTIVCPSNISSCDPVVNYTDPTFNDNCFAFLTQTDATGLSSGDQFPIGITTLTYTVSDSSSNSQSCSFQIEVLDFPSTASILVDTISLCQLTSTLIEAIPATSGIGEWTVLSGQAFFNNQFSNATGVNNIGYGTNLLVWEISTALCGSTSDTLTLIVSQTPLPASTQDTLYACNDVSISLMANVPLYGIGTWTTDLGANISNINLATATANNLASGWNEFIWTITNGTCPSTSDTSHIFATPSATIIQQDTAVCLENLFISLDGTVPITDQSVYWTFISGSGSISTNLTSSIDGISLGMGTNIITYTMEHENCPSTIDSITIVASLCDGFNPIFPSVITPNLDGKNDLFVIDFLEMVYPQCKVVIFNRWGSIVFESVGYEDPWDGTLNGEPLPMGTYFFKLELNDEALTEYNGPISIMR